MIQSKFIYITNVYTVFTLTTDFVQFGKEGEEIRNRD